MSVPSPFPFPACSNYMIIIMPDIITDTAIGEGAPENG